MSITLIIVAIIALVLIWAVISYNGFVSFINRAKEAWADIDVQLKRRYDLIPNLVNTVKGYATHESSVFENVTKARSAAMGAGSSPAEKGQAEATLAGALKSVFALAEAYPDLKANQNFLDLQNQLSATEDAIQSARRFYNGNVRELNTRIGSFPGNIIAGIFHFSLMEYFQLEATDAAKNPVEVKF